MANESSTNTGNMVGKIDQHMGKHVSPTGYKYQYVDVDKNKKLGMIHKGNVNSVLYNLLWDIVSHQVDNETAKGEMKEINWLMKRFPKDDDRDDDTGVSNDTIHKYLDKARDIVAGMKKVDEDVYVDNGKITKKSSDTSKKLSEEISDNPEDYGGLVPDKEGYEKFKKYLIKDLKANVFPNLENEFDIKINTDYQEDEPVEMYGGWTSPSIMFNYTLYKKDWKKSEDILARAKNLVTRSDTRVGSGIYFDDDKEITYYLSFEYQDFFSNPGRKNKKLNEESGKDSEIYKSQATTARHIRDDLISCGANEKDIKDYIDFCRRKDLITEGQAKDLLKRLSERDTNTNEEKSDISKTSDIRKDLEKVIKDYMKSEGFEDNEVDEYTRISIKNEKGNIRIEVGAELSYDSLMDLSDKLNKVVSKYDKEAYFDAEEPGIITSFVTISEDLDEGLKERMELRKGSVQSLIANSKEPEVVKRALKNDNKRLLKQAITGKRTANEEDLEEDAQIGKYSVRKIKDKNTNQDKWAVYDENGNQRAIYNDEQTAKKAVQGQKIYEEYNPFQDMIKSDSPEWHRGLYTDGKGNLYEAPKSGTTKWIKKKTYKYRYDFGKNRLEIADNSGDVIHDSYLSISSWLDNPDYWYERACKEIEDEEEEWLKDYLKKHPEKDAKNLGEESLNESYKNANGSKATEDDIIEALCYMYGISEKAARYEYKEGSGYSDKDIQKALLYLATKGLPGDKKKSYYEKLLKENDLSEEAAKKFKTAVELDEYLSGKNDVVIYYDKGFYSIVDEEKVEE